MFAEFPLQIVELVREFLCVDIISRKRTKARMMAMLTSMAAALLRTLESMATPCSVKAYGCRRRPILAAELEVANCDLQFFNSSGDN